MSVTKRIQKVIKKSQSILIIISRPIDHDCIASGVILKRYLRSLGKSVKLIAPVKIPKDYEIMPFVKNMIVEDPKKANLGIYDLVIALDGGNKKQFARVEANADFDFGGNKNVLNIDHHLTNSHFAKYEIWDKKASSTIELLASTLLDIAKLTKEEATLIYFGLVGDTGNFKYSLSKDTLYLASLLLAKGADYKTVVKHYFYSNTKLDFQIFTYLIDKTVYKKRLGYTYVIVDYDKIIEKFDCKAGLIKKGIKLYQDYFSCAVNGVNISVVFRVIGSNITASLKGDALSNKIPLSDISRHLKVDGGGHFNSAGFALKGDIQNVLADFRNVLIKMRKEYKQK